MVEWAMDFRDDRVGFALAGTNPTVLARMTAGFAVMGDVQHLPGYCVLITDDPTARSLFDLPPSRQRSFLGDMALLGQAVQNVCGARDPLFRRMNLEIQGNTDAFLHAHVTPRYEWEPSDIIGWPAALHHWTKRVHDTATLGPQHDDLRQAIIAEIALLNRTSTCEQLILRT